MNIRKWFPKEMGTFYALWLTQELTTALLSGCSYTPYVIISIFAGALSDRWDKRRTMLVCDVFAGVCTCATLILLKSDMLKIRHI